jgi:hypothetical protein
MTEFLHFLEGEMDRPGNYSPFHLCALALVILTAVLLCLFARKVKDRHFRLIVFLFWIVLILFETYKQIIFSFHYNDGQPTWDYQWYAFPFQMCSSPIYILPFIFLTKEGSVIRRATVAYSATYVLSAGMAVMLYPNDVFVRTIGINIQTMVWHGSQVILGVYFLSRYAKKLNMRFFLDGVIVFACMSVVAIALDLIVPSFIGDETFNMFYISPLFPSTLPVLSMIYPKVPWIVFFLLYLIGFTLVAFLVYLTAKGISKLTGSRQQKKAAA